MKITPEMRRVFKQLAKRGGKARARKYDRKTLSEWGKKGGRPRKNPPASPGPILFSKRETAAMLSLSLRMVEKLFQSGEIRPKRVGNLTMVSRAELERFAKSPQYARTK